MKLLKKVPKNEDEFSIVLRLEMRKLKNRQNFWRKTELLRVYHELLKKGKIKKSLALEKLLTKRAVRTLSGVTVVTVLTKPADCPGQCLYCPNEKTMPKSYISDEPAAARALALKFDPYKQVSERIKALQENGHPTDKIEMIVKGGTWNAYPPTYQYWFVLRCFQAANNSKQKTKSEKEKNIQKLRKKLFSEQRKNETAKHRVIGLTLETRPDFVNQENILIMRELGCTRIELGVQTIDEKILKLIKRGHDSETTKKATELLKNHGFKVDYHLMPQLPGSTPAKDAKMLKEIFDNPAYRPDMVKIYPCVTVKNSLLYHWWKTGKYKPYANKKLIELLVNFKASVPGYVRISRLIRDIPGHHIIAGNTITNLRQEIQRKMREQNLRCNCLRCREIGHKKNKEEEAKKKTKLFVDKYKASGGLEYFLSFEDAKRTTVFAFCRLRISTAKGQRQVKGGGDKTAYIRELHTYGQTLAIGTKNAKAAQHKGMGTKLIKEVEKICKKDRIQKISVISGIGVRGYYRKLGYQLENTYMVKTIN